MYINGSLGNFNRYISGSSGGYSGLGSIWGEAKTPADAKSPDKAIAKVKAAAKGQPVEPDPVKEIEQELPASASVDAERMGIKDPRDFIPQPKTIVNAFEAMQILKRPYGVRGGRRKKTKGKVYWTPSGPKFSQKPIASGKTAERVGPPAIKLRPSVKVVRDLPTVPDLEPIEVPPPIKPKAKASALQGFGEATASKLPIIIVLGLLFLLLRSYNKA